MPSRIALAVWASKVNPREAIRNFQYLLAARGKSEGSKRPSETARGLCLLPHRVRYESGFGDAALTSAETPSA